MPDPMIAALLAERASYVRGAKADRVSQVDEQLRLRGVSTGDLPKVESGPQDRNDPPKARSKPATQKAAPSGAVNQQEGIQT